MTRLAQRVAKLEQEMADVRKLASDASTEVGDVHARLRAHTKSLEALRTTQLEMQKTMNDRFAKVDERFDKLEADLRSEMRDGFSTVGVGMAQITAMLNIAIGQSGDEPGAVAV